LLLITFVWILFSVFGFVSDQLLEYYTAVGIG